MAATAGPLRADDRSVSGSDGELIESQNARIEELEQLFEKQQGLIEQLQRELGIDDPPPADGSPERTAESLGGGQTSVADSEGEESIDQRVDRLEDTTGNTQKLPSDFIESLSTSALRSVNGRVHIDQWDFPKSSPGINIIENGNPDEDPEGRLLYRRIRFGVSGNVPPLNMSYRVEIEFSGQDGSQFRDAWIGFDDLLVFNTLRIGNQKRPYAWDQLNSSNFMVFLERPFIDEAFNEDNRRFGVASYGASASDAYNWQFGIFRLREVQSSGAIIGDHPQLELAGRLAHTWWYDETSDGRGYGHLGFAGTLAFPNGDASTLANNTNQARFRSRPEGRSTNRWLDTEVIALADMYELLFIESVFNVGPLQIAGEYANLWLQRSASAGQDLHLHGAYIYASYFLTGEHIPWNRKLGVLGRIEPFEDFFLLRSRNKGRAAGWGAWQVAARYSYGDLSSADVLGGVGQSVTLALNWYWNSHSRLQFNYLFGRIDDRRASLNSGGTQVVGGSYEIAGVRVMIDF